MFAQTLVASVLFLAVLPPPVAAAQAESTPLPADARLFIASMEGDFHEYLRDAILKKKVPVTVVEDRTQAQFELTGYSGTRKSSTTQKLLLGKWRTDEQASIQIADLESGEIVFAYSVDKPNSAHGKRSTAEACAKHVKETIERAARSR
jgi:hypothetical protein